MEVAVRQREARLRVAAHRGEVQHRGRPHRQRVRIAPRRARIAAVGILLRRRSAVLSAAEHAEREPALRCGVPRVGARRHRADNRRAALASAARRRQEQRLNVERREFALRGAGGPLRVCLGVEVRAHDGAGRRGGRRRVARRQPDELEHLVLHA